MGLETKHLIELVNHAQRVVVFSGAGISTESGIPDFRGPGGVWEKHDPNDFHIDRFLTNEESRKRYWQRSSEMYQAILEAKPNPGHLAVTRMAEQGKLLAVITQNVDGLHQEAGTPDNLVIELHGNTRAISCLSCGDRLDRAQFQPLVAPQGLAPPCDKCGGLMKPATVSFGQMLLPETLRLADEATSQCDLFLVLGSSLVVYPAAAYPVQAVKQGTPLVIVNNQETPHDPLATLVIQEPIGKVMQAVIGNMALAQSPAPLLS